MIGRLDNLVDDISGIAFHLVYGGIGLLLLVGSYSLLCLGELLFRRLYRVVSACLLDGLNAFFRAGDQRLQRKCCAGKGEADQQNKKDELCLSFSLVA